MSIEKILYYHLKKFLNMQGQGQSSAAIWTAFNNLTTAASRFLKWSLKIAWTRVTTNGGFAVVGSSIVGGTDIVRGLDTVITKSDQFLFFDETDRLIRFEYDRTLLEPLGGSAMAIANLVIENTDGRFTPNFNTTIGTAILPNRPIQFYFGFDISGKPTTLPLFKGLTLLPKESKTDSVVSLACFDYMEFLNQYPLESAIYTDQTTDQIIEDILISIGFGTAQYTLDTGLNTVGFAWFQKGETAGDRIRRLCEAEEGVFYQDEGGILKFENRRHFTVAPFNTSVWDLDPDDIITWETEDSTKIINRCIVKAKPREVSSTTEIWRDGVEESIKVGETKTIWANFDNPVTSFVAPTATTDYTAFTATGATGSNVTASVAVVATNFTTATKLEITNNHSALVYLPYLRLRGTPALVTSEITAIYEDNTSISKYQTQQLEIENDFIDTETFAVYMARAIVRKYKEPRARLVLTIQGIPQLQLRDKIRVKDIDTGVYTEYRVMRIQGILADGLFTQTLYVRVVDNLEGDAFAIVGVATVDNEGEFVGI